MPLFEQIKSLLPENSDDEINSVIKEVKTSAPNAPDDDIVKAVSNLVPAMKNGSFDRELANTYTASKYGLGQRKQLEDQIASENTGPNYGAALTAFGTGLAGGNAAAAGQNYLASKKQEQSNRLAQFDKNADLEKTERLAADENDPNSDASKMAQKLAVEMGVDPTVAGRLTAAKFQQISPVLQKKYQVEQDKLARVDAAKARNENAEIARADRKEREDIRREEKADKLAQQKTEKEYALTTPYGLANTPDDAKKLKDAHESKQNFSAKIDELIALRKEFGGEAANREAVARGRQLSKDLLLEYKNMAKLGVLSQADEKIINAIIPDDPLAFNNPYEMATGQDPILKNLQKFKADADKDFENRVATRVRNDGNQMAQSKAPVPQHKPGDIVKVRGKSYKVAADGDTLEEVPNMAGR